MQGTAGFKKARRYQVISTKREGCSISWDGDTAGVNLERIYVPMEPQQFVEFWPFSVEIFNKVNSSFHPRLLVL